MEEQTTETPQPTEEQTTEEKINWLDDELKEVKENSFDGERKPALVLEENKTIEMTIDFSKPFEKWDDVENKSVKKIIPVRVGEVDLVWWLNVKNPIYHQVIEKGVEGQTVFKVLQTGNKKTTKYILVE
jgi:hypothetical protein